MANNLSVNTNRGNLIKPINSLDDLSRFLELMSEISSQEIKDKIFIERQGLDILAELTNKIRGADTSLLGFRLDFQCPPNSIPTLTPTVSP